MWGSSDLQLGPQWSSEDSQAFSGHLTDSSTSAHIEAVEANLAGIIPQTVTSIKLIRSDTKN